MIIKWNEEKNKWLKKNRSICFEEILGSKLIDWRRHPKKEGQELFIFFYKNYFWSVPLIRNKKEIFLKTIYPNRKFKKVFNNEKYKTQ